MSENIQDVASKLSSMSVQDILALVKHLESEWGVTAASQQVASSSSESSSAVAEKTSFDITLLDAGSSKINVIKEVRAITGLGLAEAKALVDSAPKEIKTGISKQEAEDIKSKIEAAGAKVEIK
jgi:large subunit ribosomal protein L7/L12